MNGVVFVDGQLDLMRPASRSGGGSIAEDAVEQRCERHRGSDQPEQLISWSHQHSLVRGSVLWLDRTIPHPMNTADAHTELARHWRQSALHEDKTHSVHEEIRQQLAASSSTTPTDLAAAIAALPPRSFLRLLSRTSFGRRFVRKRIRELRQQFFLAPEAEPANAAADLTTNDAAEEYAHVDASSRALLASFHELLGEIALARRIFQAAANTCSSSSISYSSSRASRDNPSPKQYLIDVERLSRQIAANAERQRCMQTFDAAAAAASTASSASAAAAGASAGFTVASLPPPRSVDRIHHSRLSHAEFLERYVQKRKPVVIEGLADIMFPADPAGPSAITSVSGSPFSYSSLLSHLSHLDAVPLKFAEPHSTSWARLEERGTLPMRTIVEQMQRQREWEKRQDAAAEVSADAEQRLPSDASSVASAAAPACPRYYIHDYSVPLAAPTFLPGRFVVPSYFCGDLLQSLSSTGRPMFRDSWPSLFLGARGSTSHMHVDTLATHFWMVMMGDKDDGARKRWILYDAEDLPLLYPSYANSSVDPSFPVVPYQAHFDPSRAAGSDEDSSSAGRAQFFARQHALYPAFAHARPSVAVLRSGDVLFVPYSLPHFVENLDTTISLSANCVLEDNREAFLTSLELAAHAEPQGRMSDVARAMRSDAFAQSVAAREQSQRASMGHPDSWPVHLPFSVFKFDGTTASAAASAVSEAAAAVVPAEPMSSPLHSKRSAPSSSTGSSLAGSVTCAVPSKKLKSYF